jgi:hypothetical protein
VGIVKIAASISRIAAEALIREVLRVALVRVKDRKSFASSAGNAATILRQVAADPHECAALLLSVVTMLEKTKRILLEASPKVDLPTAEPSAPAPCPKCGTDLRDATPILAREHVATCRGAHG